MNAYVFAQKLFQHFGERERKLLLNHLKAYSSRGDKFHSISVKLYDLWVHTPTTSYNEAEHLLYGERATMAFTRLMLRMKDKMLEVMTLQVNLNNEEIYHPFQKQRLHAETKLVQARALLYRKLYLHTQTLCDNLIQTALENEWFELAHKAILIQLQQPRFLENKTEAEKLQRTSELYQRKHLLAAQGLALCLPPEPVVCMPVPPQQYAEYAQNHSVVPAKWISNTSTVCAAFTHACYFYSQKAYKKALKKANHALSLFQANEKLFSTSLGTQLYLLLAEINLHLCRFTECRANCKQVIAQTTQEKVWLYELQFHAAFYTGQYSEALYCCNEMLSETWSKKEHILKWRLRLCYLLILQNMYMEALTLLEELTEEKTSMAASEVSFHFLYLVTLFGCMENVNEHNMEKIKRRFETRLGKLHFQEKREEVIAQLLLEIVRADYQLKPVHQQSGHLLDLLGGNEPEYRWKLKSLELLRFEEWFMASRINIPFEPKPPKYVQEFEEPE